MRFIIELDGVIFDIARAWHAAHQHAAHAVGWSKLDQATFWRLMRTKGETANFLPGAKPIKFDDYTARFAAARELSEAIEAFTPHNDVRALCDALKREGPCIAVTLGSNMETRRRQLEQAGLGSAFSETHPLNPDPRRRPVELKALSDNDPRTVVVASTDLLARSADAAELFCVGVATGPCNPARLHQAAVRLVFPSIAELAAAARSGAAPLVDAGLPPERLS